VWRYKDPMSSSQLFTQSDPFQSSDPTSDTCWHMIE
jgi:hypothetical protein